MIVAHFAVEFMRFSFSCTNLGHSLDCESKNFNMRISRVDLFLMILTLELGI